MRKFFDKTYQYGQDKFITELKESMQNEEKQFVVTANPETFMIAEENPEFKKALENERTRIVPDGIGVVKAARMLGYPVKERVTGVEISKQLLTMANEMKKSIYLFGGTRS